MRYSKVWSVFMTMLSLIVAYPGADMSPRWGRHIPAGVIRRDSSQRDGSTKHKAYLLDMDCTTVPDLCEARCMCWVCFDVPNPYLYAGTKVKEDDGTVTNHADKFREISGMGSAFSTNKLKTPFAGYTSAEECVRASSGYSGIGIPLVAVGPEQNIAEGRLYKKALKVVPAAKKEDTAKNPIWVKDMYYNYRKQGYCEHFYKDDPDVKDLKRDHSSDDGGPSKKAPKTGDDSDSDSDSDSDGDDDGKKIRKRGKDDDAKKKKKADAKEKLEKEKEGNKLVLQDRAKVFNEMKTNSKLKKEFEEDICAFSQEHLKKDPINRVARNTKKRGQGGQNDYEQMHYKKTGGDKYKEDKRQKGE